jgi:hypothetical protein
MTCRHSLFFTEELLASRAMKDLAVVYGHASQRHSHEQETA